MNVILAWTHEMAIFGWTSRSEGEGGSALFRRQLSFWSQADRWWLAPISHEKYKWYKTHFGEIKSVWDSFWSHICFPWPRPAQSVVVLEREIYGHFHSQGRWTCLVKLILWRTTATSPSFPRCQVQDRPRTELLMLLRGWKLGKLIFQYRKFGFSQFYWT